MIADGFYNMDCFQGFNLIDDKSIDLILCDLPFGKMQSELLTQMTVAAGQGEQEPEETGNKKKKQTGGETVKRSDLEKHLGGAVTITLFDNEVITGELHKTGEERFKNDPNLYIPRKWYFLTGPQSCLFRSSHVKKLKER